MRLRALLAGVATTAIVAAVAPTAQAAVQPSTLKCAQPNDRVTAIAISANVAYIGGRFTSVTDTSGKAQPRQHLAAIDTSTCNLLPWQADTNGEVHSLAVASGTVFAGGEFGTVKGIARSNLAGISAATATVTSFNPGANKAVLGLATIGDTLYAGGEFTTVGSGTARSRLAAFSISSGALSTTWTPSAPARVETLAAAADGSRVYVGGNFTSVNGSSAYPYLAAVNPVTGGTDSGFTPGTTFPILDVAVDGRGVYGAGAGSGGHLAIWNLDGTPQRPVYQLDGDAQAVAVSGDSVFGGGHFTNYCIGNTGSGAPYQCTKPTPRRKIFEVSLSTGSVTSWAPSLNQPFGVISEAVDPATGNLWVGGDFTKVNAAKQAHLAVFAQKK